VYSNEKLNALTRLIIIVSIVLYLFGKTYALYVLVLGIIGVIVIHQMIHGKTSQPSHDKEGYTYPTRFVDTVYAPLGMPPASPAGMPTVAQVPPEPINDWMKSLKSGQVQVYPHAMGASLN
jgi:hypothetical protein